MATRSYKESTRSSRARRKRRSSGPRAGTPPAGREKGKGARRKGQQRAAGWGGREETVGLLMGIEAGQRRRAAFH
jgi:hypothetical protein